MIGARKNTRNSPYQHLLQAQYALALPLSRLIGRPGTERYPSPDITSKKRGNHKNAKRKKNVIIVINEIKYKQKNDNELEKGNRERRVRTTDP